VRGSLSAGCLGFGVESVALDDERQGQAVCVERVTQMRERDEKELQFVHQLAQPALTPRLPSWMRYDCLSMVSSTEAQEAR
jgi:hypothetical protein